MQICRSDMCVSTQHLPISMAADERNLLYPVARLEKPAYSFMA
jgi:hypothetical protein